MSTNESLWRRLLRYSITPKPFWRKHMDERLEHDGSLLGGLGEMLNRGFSVLLEFVAAAVFLALLAQFIIAPIFLSPGFMQFGLADPIGRGLAAVCAATGQCNPQYLLAGSALAVILVAVIFVGLVGAMRGAQSDEATIDEPELLEVVSVVHDDLVRLRADLVLAGVLPLTPEEKEDA